MNGKKEIIVDELFARAMSNCRKHYYSNTRAFTHYSGIVETQATIEWEKCLREYTISWDFMDRFFIEDERMLSMFILKWSS